MYNNIVITGANNLYFESLLTLISTIHRDSFEIVDKIIVYDFGLDKSEIEHLKNLRKVSVIEFEKNFVIYDSISTIKTKCHFLKLYALWHSSSLSENILWLDAGVCTLKSVSPIFETIEKDGIFVVGDSHLNKNFTHEKCKEIMSASESEMNDIQISSGIFGFKSKGNFFHMIEESWKYAQIDGCVDGFEQNHRHDQSILSILSSRYKCPTQNIDVFGYWTDSSRNLQKAIELGSVIFVHRRGHVDKKNLLYENQF